MNFIRKANVEDFPAIYALIKEFTLFQKTPERLLNIPEQMLEERELFQAFVAEEGKDIIGFASFFFAYYSWSGKALYLDDCT